MAQGSKKLAGRPGAAKSTNKAKFAKREHKAKQPKKGTPVQLPKNNWRLEALEERDLSRAIDRANEQKVASKLLQGGGIIGLTEVLKGAKAINKEARRDLVKKKVGRVEQKLRVLEAKGLAEGSQG